MVGVEVIVVTVGIIFVDIGLGIVGIVILHVNP